MNLDDMRATQELAPGDACEWRYPARSEWNPGRVVSNGGSGYWKVEDDLGGVHGGLYIEHVRAPGTDPWGT
jgi:hypothetical protein